MWQANRKQWKVIWIVAVVLVLTWPPDRGKSLAAKAINWIADPANNLPAIPDPLPIGLDDNGDAVQQHDDQEREYYRQYSSSRMTRLRMDLKNAADPFDVTTERQILVSIAVLSVLTVWRLNRL